MRAIRILSLITALAALTGLQAAPVTARRNVAAKKQPPPPTRKPPARVAAAPARQGAKRPVAAARVAPKAIARNIRAQAAPSRSRAQYVKTSRTTTRKQVAARRPVVVRRAVQGTPTTERYQEIQQALVQKGYFNGEPNGTWNNDSIEALKRFQQEQNLGQTGKLDSMTLIALGLGPKRNLAAGAIPDTNSPPRPQDENRRPQGSERP